MIVRQLKLTNFRNFKSQTVEFQPGINVIVGENGYGKTALLDAIAKGIGGSPFSQLARGAKTVGTNNILGPGDVRIAESFSSGVYPSKIEIDLHKIGDNKRAIITRTKKSPAKADSDFDFAKLFPEFTSATAARQKKHEAPLPLLRYYSTGRLNTRNVQHRQPKQRLFFGDRLSAYHNCMVEDTGYDFIQYWFRDEGSKYLKRHGKGGQVGVLLDGLRSVIPGLKFAMIGDEGDISCHFEKAVDFFPVEQLSDGQKTLTRLFADLIFRAVILNFDAFGEDTLKQTEGIVLIDEIDLHLHPLWQRQIIRRMKKVFPKIQFIMTTHSPFILQSLKDEELVSFGLRKHRSSLNQGLSLEDVAEEIQKIEMPHLSLRRIEMQSVAEDVLRQARAAKDQRLTVDQKSALRDRLLRQIAKYPEDPAFAAFLKFQLKDELS